MASYSNTSEIRSKYNRITTTEKYRRGFQSDKIGRYALYIFLALVPFHQNVMSAFIYYKEAFAFIFFVLAIQKFNTKYMRVELCLFLLFPVLLMACALLDPKVQLYQEGENSYSSIEGIAPSLLILRNAILYVPMVVYISMLGMTKGDVRNIAATCIAIAPISIFVMIYYTNDISLANIGVSGGYILPYLNYVPYLTFAALSGMYLLCSQTHLLLKLLSALAILLIVIFTIISTGRQNVMYLLICAVVFICFDRNTNFRMQVSVFGCFILITLICGYIYLSNFEVSEKFMLRFSSIAGFFDASEGTPNTTDASRYNLMLNGCLILNPEQYLWGAGLTSSNGPGPHCDYIRWIQRVGFIVAAIGFLPFFMCAKQAYQNLAFRRTDPILIYIFLALIFTIFYSVFGFVREDPYESPFGFLGVAMALGLRRNHIT